VTEWLWVPAAFAAGLTTGVLACAAALALVARPPGGGR
jgi:hypothetical protein